MIGIRRSSVSLEDRVDALSEAIDLASAHLGSDRLADAVAVVEKVRERLRHGGDATIVALVGSTGVGKSSLFNRLVGDDVSDVGVRRPTTASAHAAVWQASGASVDQVLDWLGVARRHHVDAEAPADATGPPAAEPPSTRPRPASAIRHDAEASGALILLDLPDFDSTERANRAEVDRLVELVDAMIWVTDPQKYADAELHDGYLRPLAAHRDVLRFVLNKSDTLSSDALDAVVADFRRRLDDDGIPDATVVTASAAPTASATTAHAGSGGDRRASGGTDAVRTVVDDVVDERIAAVRRLEADVRSAAERLDTGGEVGEIDRRTKQALVGALARAADVDRAGELVAEQHRRDARAATGWPVAQLWRSWRRRAPLADLPSATASSAAGSEVDLALRDLADAASGTLEAPWPTTVRRSVEARRGDLLARLTTVTARTAREASAGPAWWTAVQWVQRLLLAVSLVGAVWLVVVAVVGGFFAIATDPLLIDTPGASWIPLPSAMVVGGVVLSLLIAGLARILAGVGARRRAQRARRRLRREVESVAETELLAPLADVLDDRRRMSELLRTARSN